MAPTKPLRLQVVDRFIAVLLTITEGESYWKTSGQIVRRWIGPEESVKYPAYGVYPGDGEPPEEDSGEYRETFSVIVTGIVKSNTDTVTEMEHALADIRRAIDADSRAGAAGALGALAVFVRVGSTWTDKGGNVEFGLGVFHQEFLVQVAGDPFGA